MGCDIHIKEQIKENDKWVNLKDSRIDTYDGRNYELFAFLKDVRNYEDAIKPLRLTAERWGLPDDMKGCDDSEGYYGDHNVFWCHVSEILDRELYKQTVKQTRLVRLNIYNEAKKSHSYEQDIFRRAKNFKEVLYPHCGDSWGPKIIKFTAKDWEDIKPEIQERLSSEYDVNIWATWEVCLTELIGDSWFSYLEELNKIGDVRLIIGFDS